MAPTFHTLRIASVRRETVDAVSLSFDVPPALRDAYTFRPGQFLTLRATIGGKDTRRSYSICSGPGEPLRVGVKRVADGVFSTWANTVPLAGDTLSVMSPDGRFGVADTGLITPSSPTPRAPSGAVDPTRGSGAAVGTPRTIAAFVAGSGITPVLSILKTVLAAEPDSRFFLFYGNRTTAGILFREEIEDLKDRYLSRLSVFHVLSREQQDIPALNGHLDADKVRLLLRTVLPAAAIDHALVCGPQAMIEDLPAVLRDLGVPADRVHVERFTPATPAPEGHGPRAGGATADAAITGAAPAMITVIHDGVTASFPAGADEAIIDAAIRAGRDLPWSCKGGMCCTCRARVTDGRVEMAVNYSLEPWELEAGYVLTCQARALTPTVTVDYDAA